MEHFRNIISATFAVVLVVALLLVCGHVTKPPLPTGRAPDTFLPTTTADASRVQRAPIAPQAAVTIGRRDCPEGWLGYTEATFSICYPPGHYAELWWQDDSPKFFTVRLSLGEPVAETPYTLSVDAAAIYDPPADCLFDGEIPVTPDGQQMGAFILGHATAVVCKAELGGATQFRGAIESAAGGVDFRSQAGTADQFGLVNQILATLTVVPTKTKLTPGPTFPPTPTPLIAAPEVRLCRRADIATSVGRNGAGGSLFAFITLGNRSHTRCQITQVPDVQLLDALGDALPITVLPGQPCPAAMFCVFQRPLLLMPGLPLPARGIAAQAGEVVLILEWSPVDGSGGCPKPPPNATQARLLLADTEDAVVVDVTPSFPDGIAPCRGTVGIAGYGPP